MVGVVRDFAFWGSGRTVALKKGKSSGIGHLVPKASRSTRISGDRIGFLSREYRAL